jgi:hypothetical protein
MATIKRKVNPVGIDKVIDRFQSDLSSIFSGVDWIIYPRVYPNPKKIDLRSKVPEFFEESEYLETFMDDTHTMTSFFIVSPERPCDLGVFRTDVSLVFQVSDLKSIFPNVTHRADEEFNKEVLDGFDTAHEYKGMTTEIQNVYREFDKGEIRLDDMNQFYVVRFNFNVRYEYDGC